MSFKNPLSDIWLTYEITMDCLRITDRSLNEKSNQLLKRTYFSDNNPKKNMVFLAKSRLSVNENLIIALWAVFERKMIDYLHAFINKHMFRDKNSHICLQFRNIIGKEIEYWKTDDVLDCFKGLVNSDLIGYAKQVKQYRDWIAHRNPKKGLTINVLPQNAYLSLSKIIEYIENHSELEDDNAAIT